MFGIRIGHSCVFSSRLQLNGCYVTSKHLIGCIDVLQILSRSHETIPRGAAALLREVERGSQLLGVDGDGGVLLGGLLVGVVVGADGSRLLGGDVRCGFGDDGANDAVAATFVKL